MGELVECSCDKNLVHHNVLLNNNNQMTTFDNTKNNNVNINGGQNRKNNKNRTRKPRRNGGNKNSRNANKKTQRKAPAPLLSDTPGLPVVGENWEWSGCDDNVNFGNRKSKDFLDARLRRRSDIKTLVKIHNNDAGRLVSCTIVRLLSFDLPLVQQILNYSAVAAATARDATAMISNLMISVIVVQSQFSNNEK